MEICLVVIINANIMLSIKPSKICTRNSIDLKLFQKYCMIDCIERLWQVDKNTNGVVVVLKWFADLIYNMSNCMFCRVAFCKAKLLWV